MNRAILPRLPVLAAMLALAACSTMPRGPAPVAGQVVEHVPPEARQAEAERQAWLAAHPDWSFQGRAAIAKGRNGGSGRVDWQQRGEVYRIQLSAPVTRQSWTLDGDLRTGSGRLEGLAGGPRAGADAEQVLLEATGWRIPVNQLPGWVRGQVAEGQGEVDFDADGRPRTLRQQGWTIEFLEWYPAQDGRPALPRRIEAGSGDAKVRLMLDQWDIPTQ
ncbi:lipoprotein insertase outer membrane protein LolB [[Pseudomonas] boreopolis]|uniref:lipoprotein insertase outer membrane protein LolB n=1 Tax=Xanthomonas boreopolis TaxID=86183 RepID=UPI003D9FD7F6